MSKRWTVIYYEDKNKNCPVQEFIDSRSERNQAKVFALLDVLEEKGPNLPRPYADLLRDEIHELRIKLSGEQSRILYFFCYKDYIVLTHSFIKNTSKVPDSEINRAIKAKSDFLSRFSDKDIRRKIDENSK